MRGHDAELLAILGHRASRDGETLPLEGLGDLGDLVLLRLLRGVGVDRAGVDPEVLELGAAEPRLEDGAQPSPDVVGGQRRAIAGEEDQVLWISDATATSRSRRRCRCGRRT